jgi:4-amino-4-deoxy-L-arabinose transferase-like glycosyltransferase
VRRRLPLLLLLPVVVGAFAFHAYRAEHPTTGYQSADERSYGKLAINIAEQHHYGDPSTGMRDPLHWPPGAPMLFAAGHAAFGSPASEESLDLPSAYWLQAVVSTGTVLAAFALAALVAGAWAGLVAAALVGFYPPLILATGEQLSEPLGAFLVVAGFAALALAVRLRAWWAYGLAGLVLGGAVLTRADLLLAPFAVAALVAVVAWAASRAPGRALLAGGLVAAGALVALAPWSGYASARRGAFVPVTSGSASALFVGTYLPGNGTTVGMKRALGAEAKRRNPKLRGTPDFDLEARSVLRVIADRHPDLDFNAAVSREGRRNITRYGLSDPVGFGRMMLNKVQRMWSRYARGGARPTSPYIRVWHILLVLASVGGLVVGVWRGRSLVIGAVALTVLYSTAVHMLVVSQARYNLPLMPALVAAGVAGWALLLAGRRAAPAEAAQGSRPLKRSDAPTPPTSSSSPAAANAAVTSRGS